MAITSYACIDRGYSGEGGEGTTGTTRGGKKKSSGVSLADRKGWQERREGVGVNAHQKLTHIQNITRRQKERKLNVISRNTERRERKRENDQRRWERSAHRECCVGCMFCINFGSQSLKLRTFVVIKGDSEKAHVKSFLHLPNSVIS